MKILHFLFLFLACASQAQEVREYGNHLDSARTEFKVEWREIGGGLRVAEGWVSCDLIVQGANIVGCDVMGKKPKTGTWTKCEAVWNYLQGSLQITVNQDSACVTLLPAPVKKGTKKKKSKNVQQPTIGTIGIRKYEHKIEQ